MNPLTVKRNDYLKNKKNSTIYTPTGVSQFLYDILRPTVRSQSTVSDLRYTGIIFDPAIGSGRLTDPWFMSGSYIVGCDIEDKRATTQMFYKGKFEDSIFPFEYYPDLVLMNPPFNGCQGRRLYNEVFLEHVFKLFGVNMPVVMFSPMGFRLNQRKKSKRWRWLRDCGANITSIISLPLDIFEGVEFHQEILIFNVRGLNAHYFLPERYL